MIALVRFLLLALLSRVPAAVSARLLAHISRRPPPVVVPPRAGRFAAVEHRASPTAVTRLAPVP